MLRHFFGRDEPTALDDQIVMILREMKAKGVNSDEYPALLTHLERLYELKATERRKPVSLDTIVMVLGGFVETLIIVGYEQHHVITSKALGRFKRPMK